jgi:short-subunit dehydrogenase
MSSVLSFYGSPDSAAYCGSKAAVRLLGEALRQRLARNGIVVSVICPGFVRTPMNAGVRPRLPFTMSADRAAAIVARGLARGKARIAFPLVTYVAVRFLAAWPLDLTSRLAARRSKEG